MSKANGQLCVLFLLVECAAVTCSASHATATATEPHPNNNDDSSGLQLPGFPWWNPNVVPITGDPKIQQCWRSLLGTESCVTSLFQSIVAGRVVLSSQCCTAIEGLGDYCVPRMFTFLPFSNLIVELIKGVCTAFVPYTSAPPAPSRQKPTGEIVFSDISI